MISSCALFYLCHREIFHDALGFLFLLLAKKKKERDRCQGRRRRSPSFTLPTLIASLGTTLLSHWEKLRVLGGQGIA